MDGVSLPLVSIVITSFNYEKFVATAIRSALDQTHSRVEVIVIDDGSTDNSQMIIESFGACITPIFQKHAGETTATNAGFAAAHGDIIMFLDSDDALRPDAAARAAAALQPDVSKVQFCLATIDERGDSIGTMFPNYPTGLTPQAVRHDVLRTALYPCPPTTGNAYARWFLEKVMPLSAAFFPIGSDGPLNTVAPLYGQVVTIDEPLGYYRVHGNNMWAQRRLQPDLFRDYVLHDCRRNVFLHWHAFLLGLSLSGNPLQRAVLHLQYRLASVKLRPERHPIAGDSVLKILRWGLRATLETPERTSTKLALLSWFLAVAFAPRRLAHYLVALRFVPTSRPARLRRWLAWLNVVRQPLRSVMVMAMPPSPPTMESVTLPKFTPDVTAPDALSTAIASKRPPNAAV